MKLIHTKIGAALADPSTWAGIAAVITGAAIVPAPYSYAVIACGVVGVLLKGGGNASGPAQ